MSENLEISREGRLLRVALNRPEKRNALSLELCRALAEAFGEAEKSPAIRAVLLSGNGKSFSVGMDLGELLAQGSGPLNTADEHIFNGGPMAGHIYTGFRGINAAHEDIFTGGALLTKPLVAAAHGAALDGGTGLIANCHIVVASEDATFGLTQIRAGLWPFLIFRSVAVAIGERRTTELALTGRIIGASEAREFGLVHEVVGSGKALDRALEIAGALAEASPIAIAAGLAYVRGARDKTWDEAGELGRNLRARVFNSDDFKKNVNAFQEKRLSHRPELMAQDVGQKNREPEI